MNRTQISNEYRALKYDLARNNRRKYQHRRALYKWVLVLAVAVLLTAIMISVSSANAFGAAEPMQVETIVVKRGDSLWGIASNYAEGRDVREVVREIKLHNALEQSNLYPGMVLEIPVKN